MSHILLLTNSTGSSVDILPALELLNHRVHILPAEPTALLETDPCDIVLLDARKDLVGARSLTQLLKATGLSAPLVLILTEGGMAAVSSAWAVDDIVLDSAGPAEVEARIRLSVARAVPEQEDAPTEIRAAGVVIDEASYTARVNGAALNLTFKEFELLKYLAQHPGRVFTRQQLLTEVWGYDYYGGTRTVDVHVRRLRAKLGRRPREPDQHRPQRRLPAHPGAPAGGRTRPRPDRPTEVPESMHLQQTQRPGLIRVRAVLHCYLLSGGHTGRTYRGHPSGGSPSHPAAVMPGEVSTIRGRPAATKSGTLRRRAYSLAA